MLVLTRKAGEEIVINDNIIIKITNIGHDKVKIGVEAPKEIMVHRREVYDNIQEEKRAEKVQSDKKLEVEVIV